MKRNWLKASSTARQERARKTGTRKVKKDEERQEYRPPAKKGRKK